eukprot:CAMPEP_0183339786 /NCGR_PEP_ID=MMETSP0164_2-20130417/6589_1 /TAXON_ID=221442 /ORGANISM="Coccolithus pelagicus ssp braarudi, Strain PLY182g" /LENGTH=51 /DNA_ID=CAMNT_0025509845 /DNA_START=188 /DNA_END=340 /DNA_ORIENTATION=+
MCDVAHGLSIRKGHIRGKRSATVGYAQTQAMRAGPTQLMTPLGTSFCMFVA